MAKTSTSVGPVDLSLDICPGRGIYWPTVVLSWVQMTWAQMYPPILEASIASSGTKLDPVDLSSDVSNWQLSKIDISLSFLYKFYTLVAYISLISMFVFLHGFLSRKVSNRLLVMLTFGQTSGQFDIMSDVSSSPRHFSEMLQNIFESRLSYLTAQKQKFEISHAVSNWKPYEINISLSCL